EYGRDRHRLHYIKYPNVGLYLKCLSETILTGSPPTKRFESTLVEISSVEQHQNADSLCATREK
ncbi:hypothetical protein PFISCL1PPCAC_23884, partial [Pristionchus fissidentatus]